MLEYENLVQSKLIIEHTAPVCGPEVTRRQDQMSVKGTLFL